MKKIFIFSLVIFSFTGILDKQAYVSAAWQRSIVKNCVKSTSVILVEDGSHQYLGAGVIISKSGLVLSAAHVVGDGFTDLSMVATNGTTYQMKVLAIDKRVDLALLEPVASAQSFLYAKIQKSNDLYVAQEILVVGHPYGEYWTVSSGIISRLSWTIWYFCTVLETTALVNPGNSGGPAFNTRGEVIGIVSAMKVTLAGEKMGIGIIIPVREIHTFLNRYKAKSNQIKRYKLGDIK